MHGNADSLSRRPCKQCRRHDSDDSGEISPFDNLTAYYSEHTEDGDVINRPDAAKCKAIGLSAIHAEWTDEMLSKSQSQDLELREFYALKQEYGDSKPDREMIQGSGEVTKALWNQWENVILKNGILYKRPFMKDGSVGELQYVTPRRLQNDMLRMCHDGISNAHLGMARTRFQVRRRAYWLGWSISVKRYCQACGPCAQYRRGAPPKKGPLHPIPVGTPWEIISMDVTGPHPKSRDGSIYILTMTDHFSKWMEAYPMRNQEAATVAKILVNNVCLKYGFPLQILTDRGTNFESQLFKELCSKMGVDKVVTTIFQARTNGLEEKIHRVINSMMAKIVDDNQKNWSDLVPIVASAYRSSQNSVTGYSPNFLILGRE